MIDLGRWQQYQNYVQKTENEINLPEKSLNVNGVLVHDEGLEGPSFYHLYVVLENELRNRVYIVDYTGENLYEGFYTLLRKQYHQWYMLSHNNYMKCTPTFIQNKNSVLLVYERK